MTIALIFLLVVQLMTIILAISAVIWAKNKLYQTQSAAIKVYKDFFTPPDSETPSQIQELVDTIAEAVLDKVTVSLSAKAMANRSHQARQENALAEDMVSDLAMQANPLAGLLLDKFPSVKKRLAKNPSALGAILPYASQLLSGSGGGQASPAQPAPSGSNNSWVERLHGSD